MEKYPWYEAAQGKELEQGDILLDCPIFLPPKDLHWSPTLNEAQFEVESSDAIILTQSCDLADAQLDRGTLDYVMLCGCPTIDEFYADVDPKKQRDELSKLRKGQVVARHLLNRCELDGLTCNLRVVDFKNPFSLPFPYVRELAATHAARARLLPPYREHLSQAFARYFMRVGLPIDIVLP